MIISSERVWLYDGERGETSERGRSQNGKIRYVFLVFTVASGKNDGINSDTRNKWIWVLDEGVSFTVPQTCISLADTNISY